MAIAVHSDCSYYQLIEKAVGTKNTHRGSKPKSPGSLHSKMYWNQQGHRELATRLLHPGVVDAVAERVPQCKERGPHTAAPNQDRMLDCLTVSRQRLQTNPGWLSHYN